MKMASEIYNYFKINAENSDCAKFNTCGKLISRAGDNKTTNNFQKTFKSTQSSPKRTKTPP